MRRPVLEEILKKRQQGFTLIEVVVVAAIIGLIGLGASMATIQVITQGTKNSNYVAASGQNSNVVYWISRDAQMAQSLVPSGQSGFPLTLSWTNWDNSHHVVTYSIVGDQIKRSYSIDGTLSAETVVGQYIDTATGNTTCEFSNNVLTLKITATVGTGAHAVTVTEHSEIGPRPSM